MPLYFLLWVRRTVLATGEVQEGRKVELSRQWFLGAFMVC